MVATDIIVTSYFLLPFVYNSLNSSKIDAPRKLLMYLLSINAGLSTVITTSPSHNIWNIFIVLKCLFLLLFLVRFINWNFKMYFLYMGILKSVLILLYTTIVYNDSEILYRNVKYTMRCICPFYSFCPLNIFLWQRNWSPKRGS